MNLKNPKNILNHIKKEFSSYMQINIKKNEVLMIKKHLKRLASATLVAVMVMGMSITTFAKETDTITTTIGDTYYFDSPQPLSAEEPEIHNSLLFSVDEIKKMTKDEFITALSTQASLTDTEIEQIVSYYHSKDFELGVAPTYGIYDHTEWQIKPYVKSSVKGVTYSTSWIGIDAYRSSVGMTKGKTETKEISGTLGFSGSSEIKKFKGTLKSEFTAKSSTTVSESQSCPAWTTMNWRPYLLYWIDTYYGKMKITTIIPTGTGVYKNVWYEDHTGTNKRKITSTTEVWSRKNTSHNLTAKTPAPPTGAPDVLK